MYFLKIFWEKIVQSRREHFNLSLSNKKPDAAAEPEQRTYTFSKWAKWISASPAREDPGLASRQLDTWEIYKAIYLVLYPVQGYGIEEIVFQRFRNTGLRRWIKMEFAGKSWFDRNNMKCTACCRFMGDFAGTNKFCWIYGYDEKAVVWIMIVAREMKAFVILTGKKWKHRFLCLC